MVKLKVRLSLLVIVQVFTFLESLRCTPVDFTNTTDEEITLRSNIRSQRFAEPLRNTERVAYDMGGSMFYSTIEPEVLKPIHLSPKNARFDAPLTEVVQLPEYFYKESVYREPNLLDDDDDDAIATIEETMAADLAQSKYPQNGSDEDILDWVMLQFNKDIFDKQSPYQSEDTIDLSGLSDEAILRILEALNENDEEILHEPVSMFQLEDFEQDYSPFKTSVPNTRAVTVTEPIRNEVIVRDSAIYNPQYTTNTPILDLQQYESFPQESSQVFSYVEPTSVNLYYDQPLAVGQSRYTIPLHEHVYKRNAPRATNTFDYIPPAPEDNISKDNYVELLKIHDAYYINPYYNTYHVYNGDNLYNFNRRNSKNGKYPLNHFHKRSCGCSHCSKTTDSSCSPEIIEKPTYIIEEAPETVEKPSFKVTEKSETITKPEFVVKEVTEEVPKPNYSVEEKVEKVEKPKYVVEEKREKVKKPKFKVEEKPEVIVKPEFVIEETPEVIEKPEYTVEENVKTVVKPTYKVETQTETVNKPSFVVKEHIQHVQKPEFVVTEKTEKVTKPEFKVEEKVEVVKKPKYDIKEEIVSVTKPNFIVEEKEIVVEKPEFIVTEEILPVQKPHYLIKETQEVVERPEFYVTEIIETVSKPNYQVEETEETVTKPSYNIEDEHQTVTKPQFVIKEEPQFVVKPEFVVEDKPIPVLKPEFIIEEVVENVQKPSYLVKSTPCYVEKPEFVVHEIVEKVSKPAFKVVEKKETVQKPSFTVEDEIQTVYKPCFNVVTCSGTPRRVSPKFVKSSHNSRHYYSKNPSYKKKSYSSQQHYGKANSYSSQSHSSSTQSHYY